MATVYNDVIYNIKLNDALSGKVRVVTADTEKLDKSLKSVQKTTSSLPASFGNLAGAFGVGLGIAGFVGFGKAVIDSLKNYEYFSASLRTLMHGDADTAKALESQLVQLATKTPFSLVEVQDATKQLLAYGFSAGTVTQNISMLGDVASALKIPFSDIAYLYGTLKTQGRAYTRDIMQFTSRGIPIIKELAKQFGVAESEMKDLVEKGKVGFPQVEKAFQSMTASGGMFYDMMAQQNATTGGQISALEDSWEQLKVNSGNSQTGIIGNTVSFLNTTASALSNYFKNANTMDENFAKSGVKSFSMWEKAAHEAIGLVSGYHLGLKSIVLQEDFQKELYDKYVTNPAKTLQEAYRSEEKLYNQLANLDQIYIDRKGKNVDAINKQRATLKAALVAVKANEKLLRDKGTATTDPLKAGANTTSSIDTIKASAPKATTINIDYGSLNLNQTISVSNGGSDFKAKVGDNTAEALLNALNDVNRIATQQR